MALISAPPAGSFNRNVAIHEIIDQVLTVQQDFQRRVSHIVSWAWVSRC